MLIPKRVKYRRQHRPHRSGVSKGGNRVTFGDYGLQALELDPGNERLQNNVRLLRELEDAAALPPVFRDSNQLPGENAE